MPDALFEALFAYRPIVFEQGEFRFAPAGGTLTASAVAIAAVAVTAMTYATVRMTGGRRDRLILTLLRVAALAVVLGCLFRPILVVRAAVPQQNFLAVLLDDSRSMQIADWQGQSRSAFVRQAFGSREQGLLQALSKRFEVRVFRFSSSTRRLGSARDLTFTGTQTKLGPALDSVREELGGVPLAGVVLVTDGADTDEAPLADALLRMKAERLPVYTVGVGRSPLQRDVQLDRATMPRSVLKGTSLLIDLVITQAGFEGETITVDVEDEGRIVGSQQVTLPSDGGPATVRVRATADEAGPRVFRFRVPPVPGELLAENNVREALVDVRDAREKILYFEGEPRFEMKFIRRAVADDENLQVVTLQRTADNKYLRLEVDNPDELAAGFPRTRDELFAYRGLVLGSVEAGAFTGDQLQMIGEFVDRRGGGLLMLGGPRAFGEGGYAGTPLAHALPFAVERSRSDAPAPALARLKVSPTRAGAAHAVTQIAATEAESAARWATLPQVTSLNETGAVKPGATVLLNGTDQRGRAHVVLASHRYGRGRSIAFLLQDSWQWQMHASMPVEDLTHENYWRQLLRWLVDGVPGPVEVGSTTDRVEPGEAMNIEASVVDASFVELNDARVVAHVTRPGGTAFDVPLTWSGERGGQYRGSFTSTEPGAYTVSVEAARNGKSVGTAVTHVRAAASDAEYFDASMHAERLRRIADDTGGRFYTPETAAGLGEDVRYAGRGVTTIEERELWQMPVVLLALLGFMCAEWGYRRAVGLA